MAIRGYFESPLHDEPWIESALDVRDRNGDSLPGYGWIFPVGDGTINVGIGLLSTFRDWRERQHLAPDDGVGGHRAGALGHRPRERRSASPPAAACRWPARSTRRSGPTWVVVGDAAGSINPFNGEGIDYAYETGRMVAGLLDEALATGDGLAAAALPRAARGRVRPLLQGGPALRQGDRPAGAHAASSPGSACGRDSLMEWVLRIMANLLRPDEIGPAEAAYKAVAAIVRLVPEPAA